MFGIYHCSVSDGGGHAQSTLQTDSNRFILSVIASDRETADTVAVQWSNMQVHE